MFFLSAEFASNEGSGFSNVDENNLVAIILKRNATFPSPGQSLFDLLRLAGLLPESIIEGSPQAYTEPLIFDAKKLSAIDKTYVFCTQSEFQPVTALVKQKIQSQPLHWHCINLETSHLPQATMPEALTQLLLKCATGC